MTSRLDKLYPALTASERVVLILADRTRGDADDPKVRATMPEEQAKTFEWLLKDVVIANGELASLIIALYHATQTQEWCWRWFEMMVARHNDVASVCQARGTPGLCVPLRPPLDLDALSSDETMAGLAPQVLKGSRDAVARLADQAQATAEILEEFSGKLGGADPLRPEARAFLMETEERLAHLMGKLEVWLGPLERDGCDGYLAELHDLIECARLGR